MTLTAPELPTIRGPDPDAPVGDVVSVRAGGARGAATAEIDLGAGAVREGVVPELLLRYVGAGNGVFGVGWDLGVPAIRRVDDRGVPRFRDDGPEPDELAYDPLGRLIPALRSEAGAWVLDRRTDGGFEVQRFEPRTGRDGSRVERWASPTTGVQHWIVTDRENVRHVFGRDRSACVHDPDDDPAAPRRVAVWLLEESSDDRGNLVRYGYKREDGAGVDPASPEARRVRPRESALHLKRVQWGNRAPGSDAGFCFELVLDYGEHDARAPLPDAELHPWTLRMDPHSVHRSGFERRTRRLCLRALLFHRPPDAPDAPPVLARAHEIGYDQHADGTVLRSVTLRGYRSEGHADEALPPTEFSYTGSGPPGPVRRLDDAAACGGEPSTLTGAQRWIDLDGTGLPGVLSYDGGTLRYKENLGAGSFGSPRALDASPAVLGAGSTVSQPFADGRVCVIDGAATPAFQSRERHGQWAAHTPFAGAPTGGLSGPGLRHVDLDGDGRPDVLRPLETSARWHRFTGAGGWAVAEEAATSVDVRSALLDPTGSTQLADMTGDGLDDLVRVGPGSISYWPSLGQGRFGTRVDMTGAPALDAPDAFDPARVRLTDVDGVGGADVLYLGRDGVTVHRNECGNGFAAPSRVSGLPPATDLDSLEVVDLLGTGAGCLIFSSGGPAGESAGLRYLELDSGQPPHLLVGVRNNRGSRYAISYAPSTQFMREDAVTGTPWCATLPRALPLVARVTVSDDISGTAHHTSWRYRHGVYDRASRELRGFGMVERRERHEYPAAVANPRAPAEPQRLVRSWYDAGALDERADLEAARATEVWAADPDRLQPPEFVIDDTLATAPSRQVLAALEGALVREEIYGLDADPASLTPLRVTTRGVTVRILQPPSATRPAVCEALPREQVERHHESGSVDGRVVQQLTLAFDPWGVAVQTAEVGYPRMGPARVTGQERPVITVMTSDVTAVDTPDAHRIGVITGHRSEELLGLRAPATGGRYGAAELRTLVADPSLPEVAPDAIAGTGRRLLEAQSIRFWNDTATAPLVAGNVGRRALIHSVRTAVLTPALVTKAYGARVDAASLTAAGYELEARLWWDPGTVIERLPAAFLRPVALTRAGRSTRRVEYDPCGLEVTVERDAAGGVSRADYDVIARQPRRVLEPTGVVREARYDSMARVSALAVITPGGPSDTLAQPSLAWTRDHQAWFVRQQPCSVLATVRVIAGAADSPLATSISFVDGAGREVLRKERAEAGPAPQRDATGVLLLDGAGRPVLGEVTERWVAAERVVPRHEGAPRASLAPHFTPAGDFDPITDAVRLAPRTTVVVDALNRSVWAEHADGVLHRWVWPDAWTRQSWDANDCALESEWLRRLTIPGASVRDQESAAQAKAHAGTPAVEHLDALGRTIASDEDDGTATAFRTRMALNGSANALEVTDPRGQLAQRSLFDLRGEVIATVSADAGSICTLITAGGDPIHDWTARDHERRTGYDGSGRRTHRWIREPGSAWRLIERTVYGDQAPAALRSGGLLHGEPWLTLDAGGLIAVRRRDAEGRVTGSERRMLRRLEDQVDWAALAEIDAAQLEAAAAPQLETSLPSVIELDARGSRVFERHPDGTTQRLSYGLRGLMNKAHVQAAGAPAVAALTSASHDARGNPLDLAYGNGVTESRTYDPGSGRLSRMTTRRPGGAVIRDQVVTYDAAGNPLRISDDAAAPQFFGNAAVSSDLIYRYDALDRLVEAQGREAPLPAGDVDAGVVSLPHPGDATAVRRYTERYAYDRSGNLTGLAHAANGGSFNTTFAMDPVSNRITGTPGVAGGAFAYDPAGNPTTLGVLGGLTWDSDERLAGVALGGGGRLVFRTSGDGNRIARLALRIGGTRDQRIELGAWERFTRTTGAGVEQGTTITVHIGDTEAPIALLELRTGAGAPSTTWRYQHHEPFGSVRLETEAAGQLLTYEEHRPYGTTAYRAAADVSQPPKRYRFGARDRDEDIGLDHCGARYYVPWLGRWANPDPAGMMDGSNRYWFVRANPIRYSDPTGTQSIPRGPAVAHRHAEYDDASGHRIVVDGWAWNDQKGHHEFVRREQFSSACRPPECYGGPRLVEETQTNTPIPRRPGSAPRSGDSPRRPSHPPTLRTPPHAPPRPPVEPSLPAEPPPVVVEPPPPVTPPTPTLPPTAAPPSTTSTPATPAPQGQAEERSWWSRGGGTLVTAGLMVGGALLFLALASNPVGWAVFAAGMALGAGTVGLGLGAHQLATSDDRTPAEDQRLNHRYGVAMAMGGSPLGLAGGAGGGLLFGERGMTYGAYGGSAIEGGYGLYKLGVGGWRWFSLWRMARVAEELPTVGEVAPAVGDALRLGPGAAPVVNGLDRVPSLLPAITEEAPLLASGPRVSIEPPPLCAPEPLASSGPVSSIATRAPAGNAATAATVADDLSDAGRITDPGGPSVQWIEEWVPAFRYSDRTQPHLLVPSLLRIGTPQDVAAIGQIRAGAGMQGLAEMHATATLQSTGIPSPFLSFARNPVALQSTSCRQVRTIITGIQAGRGSGPALGFGRAPDVGFFRLPASRVYTPQFPLAVRETEILLDGEATQYLIMWGINAW